MTHPLIDQLRFTRSEFRRGLEGLSEEDATRRVLPANCISWNVGHLAWQEQRYWLQGAQGQLPRPDVNDQFRYGAPASTPALADTLAAWDEITASSEPWLDEVTTETLEAHVMRDGKPTEWIFGSLLLRLIYTTGITPARSQASARRWATPTSRSTSAILTNWRPTGASRLKLWQVPGR
jgi:hypothetical protein